MKYRRFRPRASLGFLILASCAIPKRPTSTSETKVVNGRKIALNDITPGANSGVSLASKTGSRFSYFCSANIVGSRWIVTAQHCLDDKSSTDTYVIFSDDVSRVSLDSVEQWRAIDSIYRVPGYLPPPRAEHEWHPEFKPDGRFQIRLKADIALIKINRAIPSGYSPALISKDQNMNRGEELHFVGYGAGSPNFLNGGTRRTTLLRYTGRNFDGGLAEGISTRVLMFEKTIEGEYLCRGDSGGGLYRRLAEKIFLIAVNSYAKGSNKPGAEYYDCEAGLAHAFYLPDYRPWMKTIMAQDLIEP